MLKHVADLSDSHEYFIVWAGETNARPWGTKADGYSLFPEFENAADGLDVTAVLATTATSFDITLGASDSIAANEWAGATLRVGTTTAAATGYGVVQTNAAIAASGTGNLTITWTTAPTVSASTACYITRLGRKWGSYPNVRVLTPYQPVEDSATDQTVPYPSSTATGGRAVTLPAPYSGTTTATSGSDVGVLLPFTFFEGIDGWGVSEAGDSAGGGTHALSGITGTTTHTFTYGTAAGVVDHLNGGYVIVDWESATVPKRSWAPITDSTTTTFDVLTTSWLGDGDPGTDENLIQRWTAWVPHYNDSPYAYLPGEGYTYPNHDMMPCSSTAIGSAVHNRPRGIAGNAYGDTFGAMLVAASRLSAATGKRVNVVNLAVTDSSLVPSNARNASGFAGTLGWWDQDNHGTWAIGDSSSVYARMDKLLRTVLPNALLAEESSKSLRCLGVVFAHGETDALETGSRQHYATTLTRFVSAVRNLVEDLGYNPYANGAEIPFIQPRIAYLPHAIDGSYTRHADRGGATVAINADTMNRVNAAIEEVTTSDEFAASPKVDDLPRDSTDPAIYNGVGEAELGSRIGGQLARLADYGLGFGSTALDNTQTRLVDICNLALSNIGDSAELTSLTGGSEQAIQCNRLLPEARNGLLEMLQWGFALRRRQMVAIQKPEPGLYQNWNYCYVVPGDVLNAFKVLPPVQEVLNEDYDHTAVTTAAYSTAFVTNDGSGTEDTVTAQTPSIASFPGSPGEGSGVVLDTSNLLPLMAGSEMKPQAYAVEQSPSGHSLIFTNQRAATLQYVARVVDADLYSSQFASALAAYLGSMLASSIIKGDEGEAVAARLLQKTAGYVRMASASDSNQKRATDDKRPFGFTPGHIAHRGVDYGSTDGGGGNVLSNYPSSFRVD